MPREPSVTPPPDAEYVEEAYEPPPPPGPPPPEPRRWEIWPWLLALLIVVLAGLAIVWIATSGDDEQPAVGGGPTTTQASREQVRVPDVVGLSAADAVQRLADVDLRSRERLVPSDREEGVVVAQDPRAGERSPTGTVVRINISRGAEVTTVPDVVGMTAADAGAKLRQAGLVAAVFSVPSDRPKGVVVAQNPAADAKARKGSKVRLNVSQGQAATGQTATTPTATAAPTTTTSVPSAVEVPSLVGERQLLAQRRLFARGLRPRTVYVASDEARGTVVGQRPAAGARSRPGTTVRLEVSDGPTPEAEVSVPDVTGLDEATASQTLTDAGLQVRVVEQETTDPSEDGVVLYQDPQSGSRVRDGSAVTLLVGRLSG